MKTREIKLGFREENRDIFEAIRDSRKKVETRAATKRYQKIESGDLIKFICGKDYFEKKVKKVRLFKNIPKLLKKFKPDQINPKCKTKEELTKMYYSFPNYKEKIKKYGLIAFEL